jgi:predicted ArsR family transcriptional regulator
MSAAHGSTSSTIARSACFYKPGCVNTVVVDFSPPFAPDDVLAQPTRARLFALLSDLRRPGGTVELAERLRLHPNGVRVHLERMEDAGLVVRQRAPQVRGRPRDAWTIASGARPGGQAPHAYSDLGRWLARAIPARPQTLREVLAAGREIGRELAPPDELIGGHDALLSALTALGFEPRVTRQDDALVTVCLGNCPYRDAARDNQAVICTLHRGITIGLLDVLDRDATLTGFVPHDPDTAGCTIEISRPAAGAMPG